MRLLFSRAILLAIVLFAAPWVRAQILTGTIVNYPESDPYYTETFGDGIHSVSLAWSVNILDRSGWFYRTFNSTEVALATGVSSINQITDASIYSFTTPESYYIGPVFDAAYTGGLNSFIILKNTSNDYYGVVRIDDIFEYGTPIDYGVYGKSYSGLNATWWFQSNGTADFSTMAPEPAVLGLAVLALWMVWMCCKLKWTRCSNRYRYPSPP